MIPRGEDVVERTAALGQQLAKDAGDAARPPAAGEHVRRDRDVARRGYLSRDPLIVGPVADSIVYEHDAGKRSTAVGNTAQRVDWPAGGVDRDGFHVINLNVACYSCEIEPIRRPTSRSGHDSWAAISSNAATVGNSIVASCGRGQLDSFAATMFAALLT